MSDYLGPIQIPAPPEIPPFPLRGDYGGGMDFDPPIVIHAFDIQNPNSPDLKTEQRFVLGPGVRHFRVQRDHLSCQEYDALKAHWQQARGVYGQFDYTYYGGPGGPVTVHCRYENPSISFEHLVALLTGNIGITLLEVPTFTPDYPVTPAKTLERFPDATFTDALTAQAQHIIPLVAIQDRAGATGVLRLSNQRLTINGTDLYLPRLVDWDGIAQTLGDTSDAASFTFGNADGIFTQLVNQIDLSRATVQFALYHKESGYLIKLWAGYALPWSFDASGQFRLGASDGSFQLGLAYPVRMITRTCWKVYRGRFCPASTSNGFPDCPKSWDACVARGVPQSFGGIVVPVQGVYIKDNATGVMGFGRSIFTSVTVAADTIYQRPLQEVYTDEAMVVPCDVAGGRDESEFYSAVGIVGEGPIGGYSTDLIRQRLDGQPPHDPLKGGGWRAVTGTDPAGPGDFFGISQDPWGSVPFGSTFAAGTAFAEIRRSDEQGLQLSKVTDRQMSVTVTGGIGGWTWTAPGARSWQPNLANTVWVAINVYLRALGLRVDQPRASAIPAATMESFFDVNQAIAMASICDLSVPKLVGTGNERQFPFRGALKERKPLKDWLQEILNCCLGFFTFVNGKLWIGIRENSSVLAGNAFARYNILFKTLQVLPIQPKFNYLIGEFGDEEFDWQLNNVTVYDIDQAGFAGTKESPQFNSSTLSLVGVSNKSQAARIITTRLREEVGGVGPDEQLKARSLRFRTTILALKTMVGDVISLDHDWIPGSHGEARVTKWTLNPDWSIDIEAAPSTDSMYDLTFGPKPADVPADPPPLVGLPSINGLTWMPNLIAPVAGDPLYPDPLTRTFDLWQDYNIRRDGAWDAALWVAGEMPVNQFAQGLQPRIAGSRLAPGGTLTGPLTVYVGVTQRNPGQPPLMPSNLTALWIPSGLTNQKVTLDLIPSDSADMSWAWDLWAGTDRRTIGWQAGGTNLPQTLDFAGPVHPMTQGMPEAAARKIAIAAKLIWHSGVAGVLVTGVTAPNKIQCDDFRGSTDNWVGPPDRYLSALADQSDGSAPLWNFKITGFDSASGTFTVTPDCVRGTAADSVEPGDVLIVRSIAASADATSYTDPLWNNSVALAQFDSPGLAPGKEKGNIVRVLFGKGAGQFRYIKDNDATKITIAEPWDVIPDASSVLVVEGADWVYQTESSDLAVLASGYRVELRMRVENLRDHVALVGGFLVDDQGRYSDEAVAPLREIYVFGQPPTVREVGPEEFDPDPALPPNTPWQANATDHTIRADTSANTVQIQLPPLYVYQGRTLLILNDFATGTYDTVVLCYPGEALFDGNNSVRVRPSESLRVTAG